jgi:hypothetical protein
MKIMSKIHNTYKFYRTFSLHKVSMLYEMQVK